MLLPYTNEMSSLIQSNKCLPESIGRFGTTFIYFYDLLLFPPATFVVLMKSFAVVLMALHFAGLQH